MICDIDSEFENMSEPDLLASETKKQHIMR